MHWLSVDMHFHTFNRDSFIPQLSVIKIDKKSEIIVLS